MFCISHKLASWKEKAKARAIKIHQLKRRIKELEKSRAGWKEKSKQHKIEIGRLKKELKKKNKLGRTKIKHHSYSAEEIDLYVRLRNKGGCSLRGCLRVVQILIKLGLAKVTEKCKSPQSEWALIIDESISVGSQKVLLLLGINLDTYKFEKALTMSDVEVLEIRIQASWKGEEIDEVLQTIKSRGYKFKYCCCDKGNNLRKLLRISKLEHVPDCGHAFGNLLEEQYKNDARFKAFNKEKALFQKQNALGKYAVFLSPKQRNKGRYLNLWPTCKWANKLVQLARQYEKSGNEEEAFNKINWILKYENLITQLQKEQSMINEVNKILKTEGLCEASIEKCKKEMLIFSLRDKDSKQKISKGINEYFDRNFTKSKNKTPKICSSDIIESMFGKFKYALGNTQARGLTEASLSIANYGRDFSVEEIKQGMEDKKIKDILDWRKENLPTSLNRKRVELFKNVG